MSTLIATRSSGPSISQPQIYSYVAGPEGKALNGKIAEFSKSIHEVESIKRLIQSFEADRNNREQELRRYLDSLRARVLSGNETELTVSVIEYSWQVWQALSLRFRESGRCLEVPDACPGQDNNFMYTWSKSEHYLECEIFEDGAIDFFYRNRNSGELWGEDTTLEQGLSTAMLNKAALFAW